jgi:3-isopropylmalate/(R)-2-methylmalate dehydratase small subunit
VDTSYIGKVWKFGDNISTDLMVPGLLLTSARRSLNEREVLNLCMSANRPGWAEQVQQGDMIVAGKNFGCGSSRNAASQLKGLGISVLLAESVSRIHMRNAINSGLPTLVCPGITTFVEEGEQLQVDIVSGEVRHPSRGGVLYAEAWPADSPPLQILMAGGFMKFMRKRLVEAGKIPPDSASFET